MENKIFRLTHEIAIKDMQMAISACFSTRLFHFCAFRITFSVPILNYRFFIACKSRIFCTFVPKSYTTLTHMFLLVHILSAQKALVTDPTWIFFLVLVIIMGAPILLRRLHIPHIIGLILAGILIGEHGFNILERDSSFELFGLVGIYYIMFLAGLELSMGSVIQHGRDGIRFGILTFLIPFTLGFLASFWFLGYSAAPSLLMSCLFSSHTLVSYPIVNRYGMGRHPSVVVSVIATAFTTFLSLLVLAFVVGSQNPEADWLYWVFFFLRCVAYGAIVLIGFPWAARRFLRRYDDSVTQFVFILSLVFLSAALAKLAGLEGLLGAFVSGLVINRLIPHTSPLMTRIEFVGNALFIPYFLIGVGMIIDVRVMVSDASTIGMMLTVVIIAMLTKWLAAWVMNLGKGGSSASRTLMFGLSNAHAAGALAIVMIGTSVGLMDEVMLNATVALILVSCIFSSLATNYGARRLVLSDSQTDQNRGSYHGKCLVTYDHPEKVEVLTQLGITIRNPYIYDSLMGLSVDYDEDNVQERSIIAMNEGQQNHALRRSKKNLLEAKRIAAAADVQMSTLSRVSTNIASGILHTMKEQDVGEVILGMHLIDGNAIGSSLGTVVDGVLSGSHREVMVVHLTVPLGTLRRVFILIPEKAEYEVGFYKWVEHVCRLGEQLDCHLIYYGWAKTLAYINEYMVTKHPHVRTESHIMKDWENMSPISEQCGRNELVVAVNSRPGFISYVSAMDGMPQILANGFHHSSVMMLFPDQYGEPSENMMVFSPNGIAVTRNLRLGKRVKKNKKKKK